MILPDADSYVHLAGFFEMVFLEGWCSDVIGMEMFGMNPALSIFGPLAFLSLSLCHSFHWLRNSTFIKGAQKAQSWAQRAHTSHKLTNLEGDRNDAVCSITRLDFT